MMPSIISMQSPGFPAGRARAICCQAAGVDEKKWQEEVSEEISIIATIVVLFANQRRSFISRSSTAPVIH